MVHPKHQRLTEIRHMLHLLHRSESYLRRCEDLAKTFDEGRESLDSNDVNSVTTFYANMVKEIYDQLGPFKEFTDYYPAYQYPLERRLGASPSCIFVYDKNL